jgi:3-dehydroquinate synthase II
MKEIWVKADPWKKELVTTALEAGADAVIVPPNKAKDVKELGLITIISDDGDLKWGEDVVLAEITSAEDEEKIVTLSREKRVVVKTTDWKVIPLENLVARAHNIMVEVKDLEEARTASGVLEKGVDGLIITERDPVRVREIIKEITGVHETLDLATFKVEKVLAVGMGDRVCVDTCTMMKAGEGLLVGNSSQGLFLVHSESIENPYVSPRPFRVNAGPVHAYVMVPEGKTRYLSELGAGDEVMCVDSQGNTIPLLVGRVKIERRPLLLIEATGPNGPVSTILQNAETIRLVAQGGEALSVVKVKPGDQVLGYAEDAGRHFGHKIKETITER